MQRVRQKNTSAESALRRELHARGLRYRIHVPVLAKPRRVADVAFSGLRVAVFVDGCFWHGCPLHATWPKENAEFWRAKILANQERDRDTDERLRAEGWTVVRVWAHEPPEQAARRIAMIIEKRKARSRP
ncbi:MAG TPA: very short patch repair endonuclease [Archangium sp.]|uniref:very short patch repair endonuclease n=1 Tax=Archangium sp. TaxID=1872627 RepID=UPI002E31B64F|nr:very short patch repair endonuclease [Archangium sp.]HEX5751048.1 very short patch repair endonuclease [Archangium sp.]